MRLLILVVCLIFPHSLQFAESTLDQMHLQLEIFKSIFKVRYAPAEWKQEMLGWDLDREVLQAKEQLESRKPLTVKDFHRVLRKFFHSCQDYHLEVFYFSTEEAQLPFKVKAVNHKLLLSSINRKKLPKNAFPVEIGDELLLFDRKSAWSVLEELKQEELCLGNESTSIALATEILTHRQGMLGHLIPQGNVEITVLSEKKRKTFQMPWEYTSEGVVYHSDSEKSVLGPLKHDMLWPRYQALKLTDRDSLGARKSFLPKLGSTWWTAPESSHFHAYLFELPNRRLAGYVRIPDYRGGIEHVKEFGHLMDFFQQHAEVLVIDQLNNPGGSPLYLLALASMLTDYSLITAQHRLALSYMEAATAATMLPLLEEATSDEEVQKILGSDIDGYPVDRTLGKNLERYLGYIQSEWKSGKKLSGLCPLYGLEVVPPHPVHRFTKPIIVLVNSLDFSGGDFFPALLQDNYRATLFGERTAGAGGMFCVETHSNPLGIRRYHLTISLAERSNGMTIENRGVEPDILCKLTERDLKNHYIDYKTSLITLLNEMTHGTDSTD